MTHLLLGSLWGILGGLLAWRLKVPGGAAIGAMVACGVYSFMRGNGYSVPTYFSVGAQIAVGVVVGFSVDRSFLGGARNLLILALMGAFVYLAVGFMLAWFSTRIGWLDFDTALFGFSPGGFTNMGIIAEAEGAEAAKVSLIHFVRVFLLFIIVPLMVRLLKSVRLGE